MRQDEKQLITNWFHHFNYAQHVGSEHPAMVADVLTYGVVRRESVKHLLTYVRTSECREEWYYQGIQIYSGLSESSNQISIPVLRALRRGGMGLPQAKALWEKRYHVLAFALIE